MVGLLLARYGPPNDPARLGLRNLAAELLTPANRSSLRVRVSPEDFRAAVEAAYALRQGIYPEGMELAMAQVLREQAERFVYQIRGSRQEKVIDVVQPKPMLSLRDVDAGVRFRPEEDINYQELRWFDTQIP
jgi:hypothetical protein